MKFTTVMIGLFIFVGISAWFLGMMLEDVSNNVNQIAVMVG